MLNIDYRQLFTKLSNDLAIPSVTIEYCLRRINCEGITFLTVTLPKLGALLLHALEIGNLRIARETPDGFHTDGRVKAKYTQFQWKRGALLHFEELTEHIFDRNGVVKADADATAIWQLRQFSQYFYKLSISFTDEQLSAAETAFLKTEAEVANADVDDAFIECMRKHIETHYRFPAYTDVLNIHRPRTGPGSYAGSSLIQKETNLPFYRSKYATETVATTLEKYRAYQGYFKPYPAAKNCKMYLTVNDTADYSEVLFVPKDSRGPRVIMREPLEALKLQMAFFDWFSGYLEKETKYRINFTDQTVNRKLAAAGSISGAFATFDLKEASDRIPFKVVNRLSRNIPVLSFFLKKSRTSEAITPSGLKVKLTKLAGMGSGLTFAWLAFIIHTAVSANIAKHARISFAKASESVYVYGDDLVVPDCYVKYVPEALTKVGLQVNTAKSFTAPRKTGCFRESCGGDYYKGADVGIVRIKLSTCRLNIVRKTQSVEISGSQTIPSVSAHAAELVKNGHLAASEYLYKQIEHCLGTKLPHTRNTTSVIGRYTMKYVFYPADAYGTFKPVKVFCSKPVIIDAPEQHELHQYASALRKGGINARVTQERPNVGVPLSYYDGIVSQGLAQFAIAEPRTSRLVRTRVSGLALMG